MESHPFPSFCTTEWFREIVLKKKKIDTSSDVTLKLGQIETLSGGYASHISKVHLEWSTNAPSDLPKTLIVKDITTDKVLAEWSTMVGKEEAEKMARKFENNLKSIHNNECFMYDSFLGDGAPDIPRAICYAVKKFPPEGSDKGILVIQDLSDIGGLVPIYEGFSYEIMKKFMEAVAAIQVHGFRNEKLLEGIEPIDFKETFGQMALGLTKMFSSLKEKFPEEYKSIDVSDVEPFCDVDAATKGCFLGPFEFPVIVHGDLWTNNIMTRKENGKFIDEVAGILDWQIPHFGQPGEDIARLIVVHFSPQVRRSKEIELLQHYYKTLCQKLGKVPFSFDYVKQSYNKSMSFVAGIMILVHSIHSDKINEEQNKIMATRVSALIKDVTDGRYK